jgi:signal transduction histidine kinase
VLTRALAVRQLRDENRELELRVRESTEETLRQKEVIESAHQDLSLAYARLQSAQEQLVQQEIMASLGRLVAGVAHEANTPLSSILLSSTVIRERLETVTVNLASGHLHRSELENVLNTIGEAAGVIERASDKAAQLIANFKQLATTQSDEQNCRIEVASTLDLIVASLQPALRASRVQVQIDVDNSAMVTGNPGHFQKILLQLFSNAMTHGFRGRNQGKIRVSARRIDGMVELAFSDDGVGISADIRNKIFEPFFTTQFGQGGSGLGLYLVYNMVTVSLRGRISVESEPGKGTTFLLALPQTREVPDRLRV